MFPKSSKFSLFGILRHEMLRGFRELGSEEMGLLDRSSALREAEKNSIKDAAKSGGTFLLLTVLIDNLAIGELLVLPTQLGRIEIPLAYALFVAFVAFSGFCLGFLKCAVLLMTKSDLLGNIPLGTRFSTSKALFEGDTMIDLVSPIRNGHFLEITRLNYRLISTMFLLIYVCLLLPIASSTVILFEHLSLSLASNSGGWFDFVVLICAALGMFCATIYTILFFVPLPVNKNLETIRWSFLTVVSTEWPHPQSSKWLAEKGKRDVG